MNLFDYLFVNYRIIFIYFYLLPVSVFCNLYSFFKNWLIFKFYSSPKQHDYKTKIIQKEILKWLKAGQKPQICTSNTYNQNFNIIRPSYKDNMHNIKVNLLDILEINEKKKIIKVEPLVTMDRLISTLLPLGYTIPVVPGIDDLTIGGAVMGTGIDSSSHKFGLFHNICTSYELILSDGTLVKCSEKENCDLFHAIPWSCGTLGILTAIEIQLLPAQNFVKIQFKAYHNIEKATEVFLEECQNDENDFLESLLYNDNQCVIIKGQMVNHIEHKKLNELGKWYKPWFYQHVKSYFTKGFGVEYIPLKDYYYRHNKSIYWELKDIIPFGNNIFFRMFFGWAIPPKLSCFKFAQEELVKKLYKEQPIVQDLMVPVEKLQLSLNKLQEFLNVYPIWLCPVKITSTPGFVQSKVSDPLFINIGIYGIPKIHNFDSQKSLEKVEQFIKSIKGYKMLYGGIYMSEEEFREQYDHRLYDKLRDELNCHKAFPTIYQKVKALKTENYMMKKQRNWLL